MSVSVHCMRLAASYDTLTEDKLRYRLAQSHTHPIRSIWSPHGYQLQHRFLVPPFNQTIILANKHSESPYSPIKIKKEE